MDEIEIPSLHLCSVSVSLFCFYHVICYGSIFLSFFLSLRKADIIMDGISGLHLCVWSAVFVVSLFHFSIFFFFLPYSNQILAGAMGKLVLRGLKGVDVIICQAGWRQSDNGSFNQVGNLF